MKKIIPAVLSITLTFLLASCTLSLFGTPTPFPTAVVLPTLTPVALPTSTPGIPTATATIAVPTLTPGAPIVPTSNVATSGVIIPGIPSGPYAVILVASTDVLNVRSGPGAGYSTVGSFASTATNVMRAGPSAIVDGVTWVQVQNPSGWVNSTYLTQYVTPQTFCADGNVNTLIANLGNALKSSNGQLLASLVSPAHGMTVHLWIHEKGITFDREHARWVFDSTYANDWGVAPGSGLETTGSFHETVLPKLLDVINAPTPGYTLTCDKVQTGGASYDTSWRPEFANVNFYSLYKPGPAGNELSWRTVLVGVEYVNGLPYIFSLTQLEWEP
jgi:hypothetical protein